MNTVSEDRIHREGVLMFLLHEATVATVDEVVRYRQAWLSTDRHPEIRDGTKRAITELAALGVVNVEGQTVFVSRAAREVHQILEGDESPSCHA